MSKRKKTNNNKTTTIGFAHPEKIPTPEECLSSLGTFPNMNGITPVGIKKYF